MKIVMLVNWRIYYLFQDRGDIQLPGKFVEGQKYWFFRYWQRTNIQVDVIDFTKLPFFHDVEKKKSEFYIF